MIVTVIGASGKMGKLICQTALERGHTVIEVDKQTEHKEIDNIQCDVVIDFSSPDALPITKTICINNNASLVYGTTGCDSKSKALLKQIADNVQVTERPNFSYSIQPFCQAVERLASSLIGWDVIIEEHHRRQKKDSPSGTALQIKHILEKYFTNVDVVSLRYGDTIGIHKVIFSNGIETIELTHTVTDRKAFALGSVLCAESLVENRQ